MIKEVMQSEEKKTIAREILEALPEWFGLDDARETYIQECVHQPCYVAMDHESPIGFLCLKETGKDTMELSVMGVLKAYHQQGIGRDLFAMAKRDITKMGYSFVQVKTVKMGCYEEYDATNKFYLRLGFKEFEIFPTLWDEHNPCQIYVMAL